MSYWEGLAWFVVVLFTGGLALPVFLLRARELNRQNKKAKR